MALFWRVRVQCYALSTPLSSYDNSYWTLSFDSSPTLMQELVRRMRVDPRVVRWSTKKVGERLDQIAPSYTPAGIRVQNLQGVTVEPPRPIPDPSSAYRSVGVGGMASGINVPLTPDQRAAFSMPAHGWNEQHM